MSGTPGSGRLGCGKECMINPYNASGMHVLGLNPVLDQRLAKKKKIKILPIPVILLPLVIINHLMSVILHV